MACPPPTSTALVVSTRRAGARPPRARSHPRLSGRRCATLLAITLALLLLAPPPAAADPPVWRWPLPGQPRILRTFNPPPEPWRSGHRGVDLAASPSTTVLAPGPGTVTYAAQLAGRGVVSLLHPGGLRTTYLPVQASVRRGQTVSAGDPLGVLEAVPGHCREPCLHWGLLRGPRYLDPLLLLAWAPIRLLPHWHLPPIPLPPPPLP
ncbi:murein hydrolase activator EnvC family protein [Nonomuraea africana]|uniref:Murein DD-endopeptidase MepM/ murein hydrolase activator NlpD n=1 Tax=Nonomuraea africana TaxID=46171 RepID=A0ABR9KWJ3_9ACTN|nr:M23 family metallopeptidase [Nonomuraea africana]MBE1566408.1 murein DD-endopeptidase MepM/ murein hydrolase activator NlpD [Nonomuraea africana]